MTWTDADEQVLVRLRETLQLAQEKHPVFAEGVYQALGRITEEEGELAQAVNKGESESRVMAEAFDLLTVVFRFCRRDFEEKCQ